MNNNQVEIMKSEINLLRVKYKYNNNKKYIYMYYIKSIFY